MLKYNDQNQKKTHPQSAGRFKRHHKYILPRLWSNIYYADDTLYTSRTHTLHVGYEIIVQW